MAIEPLTIKISEEKIEDLRSRLKNAKLAPDFNNSDWRYGTNRDYLESLSSLGLTTTGVPRKTKLIVLQITQPQLRIYPYISYTSVARELTLCP